ncbi:DMT family transporter [Anaeromyxobacter paludicola]|uniref:Permease n=1 Tax=Anaeromyxobacter paludicola TaxID=2918171 RepID=A0ABM7XD93_9BACT|nr:DMT family transporter [Anaeromyxobacter paludicola]BDG09844.1 permease [Anaeromyxobacter paludicola]
MPDARALAQESRPAAAPARAARGGHAPPPRLASGALCAVASGLCFGALPIFARVAYAAGADTQTLLLLRFTSAAAFMWLVVFLRRQPVPRGRTLLTLAGMGALGYAGQAFSYFTAVRLGSAGLAALLLYLYPALVALLARVVFHHPLSRLQLAALVAALAGSLLTIGKAGEGTPVAVGFGLLAAFIYAGYILTGSRLPERAGAAASTAVVTSAAAVVYGVVACAGGLKLPGTPAGWWAVAGIAVVCTVLAIGLFLAGLERIGPVRASVYSTVEPACTLVLAATLLGEPLTASRLAGGALIVGAVLLLARADLGPRARGA